MAKILVVDDEEIARITLADILRLEGHTIRTAGSGAEGVSILRQDTYDIMILDLRMPGMSGIDVLRVVVDEQTELQVIVLTAHGSMDSAIQALRFRVHDYLLKPVSPAQIINSISAALQKKKALQERNESGKVAYQHTLPGGSNMDLNKRTITWENGGISLTPTEARLLGVLITQQGKMLSHAELVHECQGYSVDNEEAAKILRPVVSRLRQKLTGVPGWNDWIRNVRGSGYVLEFEDNQG
ncbi:MAG: response regulator transcription factor [Anaerolineae bacterium]|nr:response regulator transcription factor [Anaerolineae bacterium]